jgi:hypothetical protein
MSFADWWVSDKDRVKKALEDTELCRCMIYMKGRWHREEENGKQVRVYRCDRCGKRIYAKVQP